MLSSSSLEASIFLHLKVQTLHCATSPP
uniref:Uncharacterized protein n=1 Tax=Rhizophora mucronata TaxID=61149 RepID=A0A2P2NA39_RHIMU